MLSRFTPLFHYEFAEDGGAGAAPEAAAPATEAPSTPEPSQPVGTDGSGWSGPSEDEWYETQATLRAIAERFSRPAEPQSFDQGPGGFEWDPLADDADQQLASLLSQRDEALLARMQEMLSPVVSHTIEQRTEEAEARAMDVLADIEANEGPLPEGGRGIARVIADSYFPQAAQRYGNSPRAAEAALKQGYQAVNALLSQAKEQAVNEYKASLANAAGAPAEPGMGASGSGEVLPGADSEMDVVARLFGTRIAV